MQRKDTDRIVELLEEERKRLARDVHDGPAQSLTNVTMRLDIIKRLVENSQDAAAIAEVERLQAFLRSAINDTRRMIFDLRPTFLENGITEAIHRYSHRFAQSTGLEVQVTGGWNSPAMPRTTEVAMFRVCQEALNNTFKHAAATTVKIVLSESTGKYRVTIQDDGKGFEANHRSLVSFGLQGMVERMALVDGEVQVHSELGRGTTVVCEVLKEHEC